MAAASSGLALRGRVGQGHGADFPALSNVRFVDFEEELLVTDSNTIGACASDESRTLGGVGDPQARYPSMRALLRDLHRRRGRGRRWVSIGAVGGLVALGAWGWSDTLLGTEAPTSPCVGLHDALADVYDREAVQATLQAGWNSTGDPDRLLTRLDAFAQTWTARATAFCREVEQRGEVDPSADPLEVPAMRCFRDARAQLDAVVNVIGPSRDDVRAFAAADALPALDRCRYGAHETTLELPDDRSAAQTLARARLLASMHEHAEAVALLDDVEAHLDARTTPGLAAATTMLRAKMADERGDQTEALMLGRHALSLAERSGSPTLRADAWKALADAAFRSDALDDALFHTERLESIAASLGDPAWLRTDIARVRGTVAHLRGDHADAKALLDDAIAAAEEVYGADDRRTSGLRDTQSVVLRSMGRPAEALAVGRRALEGYEQHYGPQHPRTAKARVRLANSLAALGDSNEALEAYARAYAVLSVHPVASPDDAAAAGFSYAQALNNAQRLTEASEVALRSRSRAVASLGKDSPYVLAFDMVLAANALDAKDYPAAIAAYESLVERQRDDGGVNAHVTCINLATALHRSGLATRAGAQIEACDAMVGTFALPTPLHTASSQLTLAEIEEVRGGTRSARERYTEAARIFDEHAPSTPDRGRAHLGVARLGVTAEERRDSELHVEIARGLAKTHPDAKALHDELARWEKTSASAATKPR